MFASPLARGARRRGIVLILILGMLGLLALIGVTFATFAGQSLVNARNFNRSENRSGSETVMDYALAQLINDTSNPLSALRGHGLVRDMYGNDSIQRGTTAGEIKGYLDRVLVPNNNPPPQYIQTTLQFTDAQPYASNSNSPFTNNTAGGLGLFQYKTNIPTTKLSYQYNGLNFTRWVLRTTGGGVAQTFEVLEDDDTGQSTFSAGYHVLTLSPSDGEHDFYAAAGSKPTPAFTQSFTVGTPNTPNNGTTAAIYVNQTSAAVGKPIMLSPLSELNSSSQFALFTNNNGTQGAGFYNPITGGSNALTFVLDGRYMRAFNGPGLSRPLVPGTGSLNAASIDPLVPFNVAAFANFRVNGTFINPLFGTTSNNAPSFPTSGSFGDPDLIGMDEDYDAPDLDNWFLAVQSADGQVTIPSFHRPSILTAADWQYKYGGAGQNNAQQKAALAGAAKILRPRSVDQSPNFPIDPLPDATTGKITYDVDNDGDGVTDSVWLDLGYPVQRDPGGKLYKPLFAFMVLGQNGRLPLNTVGNLQARDTQGYTQYNDPNSAGSPPALPAGKVQGRPLTFFDAPTWDHTSHVGGSANEINPKFALQNAPANVYSPNATTLSTLPLVGDSYWSQVDNAYVDVSLTQLRNLLAGTIPQDNPKQPVNPNTEANYVNMSSLRYYMPNGVIDPNDSGYNASAPLTSVVSRTGVAAVPGRWGEPEGIPTVLAGPQVANPSGGLFVIPRIFNAINPNALSAIYTNPVRAGRSFYPSVTLGTLNSNQYTADAVDDDFDSLLPQFAAGLGEYAGATDSFGRVAIIDNAGQVAIASQRIMRFVTPTDHAGVGRVVDHMNRPNDAADFGQGYDAYGRVGYFRHFRPAGVPLDVTFPVAYTMSVDSYKMPVFGYAASNGVPNFPNTTNNVFHGYESFRAPVTDGLNPAMVSARDAATIAVFGAAPYDIYNVSSNTNPFAPFWPVVGNPNPNPALPPLGTSTVPGSTYQYVNSSGVNTPFVGPFASPYVNSSSGPFLFGNQPIDANMNSLIPPYFDQNYGVVVNGYPGGSLNKDEADEMNLYQANRNDQPFGPSDLEWLYRKQDVDGATLSSRLSSLAPVSFTNSADGTTRRRLFSLETWEPNSFVYANDNPALFTSPGFISPFDNKTVVYNQPGGAFPYNSRFGPFASANFETMNQVAIPADPRSYPNDFSFLANAFTTLGLPNPSLPTPIMNSNSKPNVYASTAPATNYAPNPNVGAIAVPAFLHGGNATTGFVQTSNPVSQLTATQMDNSKHYDYFLKPNPASNNLAQPSITPALAHRDRRINLNMPFPVASDPAEPVRQKWIRETYQLLKSILPPQSIDTPEELAALSQYVVNIVDFRDPDATTTRFVNTDLAVYGADSANNVPPKVTFSPIAFPVGVNAPSDPAPYWDATGTNHIFTPFDPMIAYEQTHPNTSGGNWTTKIVDASGNPVTFLVQYGMEYSPVALNEVLCYTFNGQAAFNAVGAFSTTRFYVELVNTLTDDSSHASTGKPIKASYRFDPTKPYNNTKPYSAATNLGPFEVNTPIAVSSPEDLTLQGWDMVIMPDDVTGRPDPITGNLPANLGGIAHAAPIPTPGMPSTFPAASNLGAAGGTATLGSLSKNAQTGMTTFTAAGTFPPTAIGWGMGVGMYSDLTLTNPPLAPVPSIKGGTPWYYVMANIGTTVATATTNDPAPIVAEIDSIMPPSFIPNSATPPTAGTAAMYWLYLRRPANPFNPGNEMVVVDAVRFPWVADNGTGPTTAPTKYSDLATAYGSFRGTIPIFSAQRQQPYRGGQIVPTVSGVTPISPPWAYGYTDQTIGPQASDVTAPIARLSAPAPNGGPVVAATDFYPIALPLNNPPNPKPFQGQGGSGYWAFTVPNASGTPSTYYTPITSTIIESIGDPAVAGNQSWDHFPFHDRDFNSVAELLLVPGCPPGLFTKQFIDSHFRFNGPAPFAVTATGTPNTFTPSPTAPVATPKPAKYFPGPPPAQTNAGFTGNDLVPTFPYLPDKFYYTAASVNPDPNAEGTSNAQPYPTQLGGWTGTGWYKMFDFFEVPTSAYGAIGTADTGENFDWFRADLRPGMLNLNLIIDEEVFFGLLDDPRLNIALAQYGYYLNNSNNNPLAVNPSGPIPNPGPGTLNGATLPEIVSQVNFDGTVSAHYPVSDSSVPTYTAWVAGGPQNSAYLPANGSINYNYPNSLFVGRGFTYVDPSTSNLGGGGGGSAFNQNTISGMKAAFADFLKLRHGGSNFLYGHQMPGLPYGVLSNNGLPVGLPPDQFYHSLSFPDINGTVMRPAVPRPSLLNQYVGPTGSQVPFSPPFTYTPPTTAGRNSAPINGIAIPTAGTYSGDPGLRYPWMDLYFTNTGDNTVDTSAFPVPYSVAMQTAASANIKMVPPIPTRRLFQIPDSSPLSNASTNGNPDVNLAGSNPNYYLADPFAELFTDKTSNFIAQPPSASPFNPSPITPPPPNTLANHWVQNEVRLTGNRQHPLYRTELLQKVMNLSTVRTHQFAVWITVGFFEVTKAGTPELGIPDIMAGELNAQAGKATRARSFFLIDRTKATGFNPSYPGDFRDCVTYRRRIE